MDDDKCQVILKDDFGGEVLMTYDEFTRLATQFMEHV
jgi:hypothetical protein